MKNLILSLCLAIITPLTAGIARGYNPDTDGALADVEIHVIDERGESVPEANVIAAFYYNDNNSKNISGLTDTNGVFAVKCKSNWEAKIYVRKGGYYETSGTLHFKTSPYELVRKTHKWSEGPVKSDVVLKRIVNPQNIKWMDTHSYNIPVLNQYVGFDLVKNDWCRPYGNGVYDDFQFKLHYWQCQTNSCLTYSSLEIAMTNSVDGFYGSTANCRHIIRADDPT